jgi:hypothetical protein
MPQHPLNANCGRQVKNDIRLFDEPLDQLAIQHGAFDYFKRGLILDRGKVGASTSREIVENGDVVASFDQAFDQVRANETGTARNQRPRH